ncbi:MAG: thioredoxin [Treponemataceae bacterium]
MAMTFTKENFDTEALKSNIPVLADFWAPWCGPCRAVGPILDELSKELEGKVKIGKVNVDEQPDLASQYGVMSIPTLILFKDGKIEKQQAGSLDKQSLLQFIGI